MLVKKSSNCDVRVSRSFMKNGDYRPQPLLCYITPSNKPNSTKIDTWQLDDLPYLVKNHETDQNGVQKEVSGCRVWKTFEYVCSAACAGTMYYAFRTKSRSTGFRGVTKVRGYVDLGLRNPRAGWCPVIHRI